MARLRMRHSFCCNFSHVNGEKFAGKASTKALILASSPTSTNNPIKQFI